MPFQSSLRMLIMNPKTKEDQSSYCFPRDFNATPSDAGVSNSVTGSRSSSRSSSPKFDAHCYRLETITSPASRETLAASPTPSGSASSVSSSTSGSPHHHRHRHQRGRPQPSGIQSPREHHNTRRRYKPPLGSSNRHSRSVLSDNASETYVSSDSEVGSEEDELDDEQDNYYFSYEEEGSQHAYKDDQSTVSGRSGHSGRSSIGISIPKQQPVLPTSYISTHEKAVVLKQPPSPRNHYHQSHEIVQQLALPGNNKIASRPRPFETNDDLADLYQYSDEEDSLADLNELIEESSARWKNNVELVVHQTVTSQTIQQKQQQQQRHLLGTTSCAAAECTETSSSNMTTPVSFSLPSKAKTKAYKMQPTTPEASHPHKHKQPKPQVSEIEALRMALEKTNVGQKPASVVPVTNHPTSRRNDIDDTAKPIAVLKDEC